MVETGESGVGREPDDLIVYARRRTRMMFLRLGVGWGTGHPVVTTESRLVEMASSKLRETLLASYGDGLAEVRPSVEMSVRETMRSFVPSVTSNLEGREALYKALMSESFEDLFVTRGS